MLSDSHLGVHLPANLPIYVVMVTFLNEFKGNGVGTHWAGQGLLCASGEVVEQLASFTTQAAKVDGCCAGLTWPASSLEGLLQSISLLIGVIAWGSPSKLSYICWQSSSQVGMRVFRQPHRMVFFMVARMAEHQ